jgi:hypothetical protein
MVDSQFVFLRQKIEAVRINPHCRQEGLLEIEHFLAPDDIIDLPINLESLPICRAIVMVVLELHGRFPPLKAPFCPGLHRPWPVVSHERWLKCNPRNCWTLGDAMKIS